MNEIGVNFGLIVTGAGEERFLPGLFKSLRDAGPFHFQVLRRIGQLSPVKKSAIPHKIPSHPLLKTNDELLALTARGFLMSGPNHMVILVDDLEYDRKSQENEVFKRYRTAIDTLIADPALQRRVSVHFLVMMLEAYFFADARALNQALNAPVLSSDYPEDVETIRHPKREIKALFPGYNEIEHGEQVVQRLDVEHILSNPNTCGSLRCLFAWCVETILEFYPEFRNQFPDCHIEDGVQFSVTNVQLSVFKR